MQNTRSLNKEKSYPPMSTASLKCLGSLAAKRLPRKQTYRRDSRRSWVQSPPEAPFDLSSAQSGPLRVGRNQLTIAANIQITTAIKSDRIQLISYNRWRASSHTIPPIIDANIPVNAYVTEYITVPMIAARTAVPNPSFSPKNFVVK